MSDDIKQALQADGTKSVKRTPASTEALMLNNLLGIVNTPEFSADERDGPLSRPPAEAMQAVAVEGIPTPLDQRTAAAPARTVTPPAPLPQSSRKKPLFICTTGRIASGKDFVLSFLGYEIMGFAEPLYALQQYFFGNADKTLPGARQFLQTVGQWGRGLIAEKYPITATRAVFIKIIKTLGASGKLPGFSVKWDEFGDNQDLWLNALLERRRQKPIGSRIGVSNVRFSNELEGLKAAEAAHFHIMCSPATWAKRLKAIGLTPSSPSMVDTSEQLAIAMDEDVYKTIRMRPDGPKLKVIWNDQEVASPSPRLFDLKKTTWTE